MPKLEMVKFDVKGMEEQKDRDNPKVWITEDGDGIGLFLFNLPPDIKEDLANLKALQLSYSQSVAKGGGAIVSVDVVRIDDVDAVRTILKVPQKPTGMTYIGSFTLPFRDFSYVVKMQCVEANPTGLRDAVVFDKLLGAGTVKVADDGQAEGWMQDPYDPERKSGLRRNLADDEKYDADFPQHPLSRLRSMLKRIQGSLKLDAAIKGLGNQCIQSAGSLSSPLPP